MQLASTLDVFQEVRSGTWDIRLLARGNGIWNALAEETRGRHGEF